MLKEIISTVTYEIDDRATGALPAGRARELRVDDGVVWATRSGDMADYWLSRGATLPLARDQIVWLSAEGGKAARVVLSQTSRTGSLAAQWRRLPHLPGLLDLPLRLWRRLRTRLGLTRRACDTCPAR